MNKIAVTKNVLNIMTSLGTGAIVHQTIRNNVDPTNLIQKITIPVASYVLAGLVANASSSHMDAMVDEYATKYTELKAQLDAQKDA